MDIMASKSVNIRLVSHDRAYLKDLTPGTIVDTCGSEAGLTETFKDLIEQKLLWSDCPYQPIGHPQRLFPSPLLSDHEGLNIFTAITRLPCYYQLSGEIALFKDNATELATAVRPDTIIMDLGCGDVRKVKPFLDALEAAKKEVLYFALDLAHQPVKQGLELLLPQYNYVKCFGIWGTFDDGIAWLNQQRSERPRLFLSLGSIYGNDHFHDAVSRIVLLKETGLRDDRDSLLLTMDATSNPKTVWDSYHDPPGLFDKLMRNGLHHSNRVLGVDWYHDEDWKVVGEMQDDPCMHRFIFRCVRDVAIPGRDLVLKAGTEIDCYEGFKYPPWLMRRQFGQAGLHEIGCWKAPRNDIYQYLLKPSDQLSIDLNVNLPHF